MQCHEVRTGHEGEGKETWVSYAFLICLWGEKFFVIYVLRAKQLHFYKIRSSGLFVTFITEPIINWIS